MGLGYTSNSFTREIVAAVKTNNSSVATNVRHRLA